MDASALLGIFLVLALYEAHRRFKPSLAHLYKGRHFLPKFGAKFKRPPEVERPSQTAGATRTNHLGHDSPVGGGGDPDASNEAGAFGDMSAHVAEGQQCSYAGLPHVFQPARPDNSCNGFVHGLVCDVAGLIWVHAQWCALAAAFACWLCMGGSEIVTTAATGAVTAATGAATVAFSVPELDAEKAADIAALMRDHTPVNFNLVDSTGTDGSKYSRQIEMALPPDATVAQLKVRLLMARLNKNEFCTVSKALPHMTLQKTEGPHLANDQRIGDLDLEGRTLTVGWRGVGGGTPSLTPEEAIAQLQSGLFAQHDFMRRCTNFRQLKGLVQVYNEMVDDLVQLYGRQGIDAYLLPEAEDELRLVRPRKLHALEDGSLVDLLDHAKSKRSKPKRRASGGAGCSTDSLQDQFEADALEAGATLFADRSNGEFWTAASKDPSKDPRNKPLQEPCFTEAELEELFRKNPHLNPNPGEGEFKVTDENREHFMCLRPLDPSLTGHTEEEEFELTRLIYKEKIMGPKQPTVIRRNDDGSYITVASGLLSCKPCDDWDVSVINVLLGRAQSGKSYEGVADSWAKFFVHAQFPMYYCRTMGGLNDTEEMLADFHNWNADIETFLKEQRAKFPDKYRWLTDAKIDRYKIQPRLTSAKKGSRFQTMLGLETEVVDCAEVSAEWGEQVAREAHKDPNAPLQKAIRLKHPQVLIGLMNPASVKKVVENGCVLPDVIGDDANPAKLNLDGNGYLVTKEELRAKVFSCQDLKKRFTPFSLLCGVTHFTVSLNSHTRKQASKTVVFHSAYAPACWDTTCPYDQGSNAKRARISRLVDEVDASTSDKKNHKGQQLNHRSTQIGQLGNRGMDPKGYDAACTARDVRDACEDEKDTLLAELERLSLAKQRIENGEPDPGDGEAMDVDRERANLERDARHEARGRAGPSSDRNNLDPHWQPSDDEDGAVEVEAHYVDEDDDDDDDNDSDGALFDEDGCEIPPDRQEELDKIAEQIEEVKAKLAAKNRDLDKFEDELSKAVRASTAGHVTGMQSACMYTVGVSATIFGCLQKHRGGKTQTRLTMLPTPDAYNDLVLWNEEASEYRKLIDPSRPEKKGDIRIIEADINPIEYTDMAISKNKNDYYRTWMVNKGKGHMDGERFIPSDDNPVGKPNARGVFSIKKELYFFKEGEDPPATHVPWVAEMRHDYEMQRENQALSKRVHNAWPRTGKMFERLLDTLQNQREPLKRQRRTPGGLIITNETRRTRDKDRLIADMYKRANPALMKDVCMYNYAGDCLSLHFRPDSAFEHRVLDILENTDEYVHKLRDYLKGDPTMHQARPDKHGNPDTKLGSQWLVRNYIAPIRDVLSTYAVREGISEEDRAKHRDACDRAERAGDPEPPPLRAGKIKIHHEVKDVVDLATGNVIDRVPVCRIDFKIGSSAPQPRYMATLFTLIDAHNFKYDADGMLPTPFIGLTKTVGGRAQRYMCHGHRSRIQAMCHAFDIFPNKKLGICMADALQEAQRAAGYDELERFKHNYVPGSDGMWGEHMDGWEPQVYITTPDFMPLIRNGLQSQVEWARMLSKEQRDPQRLDGPLNMTTRKPETDEEYEARKNESPSECFARVIGNQVKECLIETINIYKLGLPAKRGDMPTFPGHEYPNLHMFLNAHVNSAPSTAARLLRHCNQDRAEGELRDFAVSFAHDHLMAELAVAEAGHETNVGEVFFGLQQKLMEKYDEEELNQDEYNRILKDVQKKTRNSLMGKVPIPVFSAVHAPGGALEERDRVEAERVQERLQAMYAGRAVVQQEWERVHGAGFWWHQKSRSEEAKNKWYIEQAVLMKEEGVPTNGGPALLHGYKKKSITDWYNKKHGLGSSRKRTRGADREAIAEHNRKAQAKYDLHVKLKHFSSLKSCFKVYKDVGKEVDAWKEYLKTHRHRDKEQVSSMGSRLLYGLSSVMNDEFTRLCKSGDAAYSGGLTNAEELELNYETMREGFDVKAVLFETSKEELHDSMGKYYNLKWTNKHESEEAHAMAQHFRQYLDDRENGRIPATPPPRPPTPQAPLPVPVPVRQPGQTGAALLAAVSAARSAGSTSSGVTHDELEQIDRDVIADTHMQSIQMEAARLDKRQRTGDD